MCINLILYFGDVYLGFQSHNESHYLQAFLSHYLCLVLLHPSACDAGHGDRNDGNGPTVGIGCTECGEGSYAAKGNNTCTSCGQDIDTGGNPRAASVDDCG